MKIGDVINENEKNKKYLKLKNGENIVGYFTDDIRKNITKFKDQLTGEFKESIRFELPFTYMSEDTPVTKIFSCSASFLSECADRASLRNQSFDKAKFSITRRGEGLQTKYFIEVL